MSIFDKTPRFTEARDSIARGDYPYFHAIEEATPTRVRIDGDWKLMAGSNNYLGLTDHPQVVEAGVEALRRLGSGCTGSRLLNGTFELHLELERRLAAFLDKPSAIVFTTGYQANLGTLAALLGRDDHVFLDRLNHACILDGARLGYGSLHRYNHGDFAGLARLLDNTPDDDGKLVATDGVFSMDGDIVDLPALVEVVEAAGAQLMVDDAHALGVLGPTGAGTAEHFGLTGAVDLIMATFSKSLGSVGGVVAGSEDVIHFLRHRARPFVFSASMAPSAVATTLKALDILQNEPERRERLWRNTRALIEGLAAAEFDIGDTSTPIVPLLVGDYPTVLRFWRALFDAGVFVNAVVPPGVPEGSARLRISLTAEHSLDEVDQVIETLIKVRRLVEVGDPQTIP